MALLNETKLRTFGSEYLQNRGRTIYAANEELIKDDLTPEVRHIKSRGRSFG